MVRNENDACQNLATDCRNAIPGMPKMVLSFRKISSQKFFFVEPHKRQPIVTVLIFIIITFINRKKARAERK